MTLPRCSALLPLLLVVIRYMVSLVHPLGLKDHSPELRHIMQDTCHSAHVGRHVLRCWLQAADPGPVPSCLDAMVLLCSHDQLVPGPQLQVALL